MCGLPDSQSGFLHNGHVVCRISPSCVAAPLSRSLLRLLLQLCTPCVRRRVFGAFRSGRTGGGCKPHLQLSGCAAHDPDARPSPPALQRLGHCRRAGGGEVARRERHEFSEEGGVSLCKRPQVAAGGGAVLAHQRPSAILLASQGGPARPSQSLTASDVAAPRLWRARVRHRAVARAGCALPARGDMRPGRDRLDAAAAPSSSLCAVGLARRRPGRPAPLEPAVDACALRSGVHDPPADAAEGNAAITSLAPCTAEGGPEDGPDSYR